MRKISIFIIIVLLIQLVPLSAAAAPDYTPQAETLKQLGLFLGTDIGFELERKATRLEAAVMTVRLLGKDPEARSGGYAHPFTDVPDWADPYIGYLYYHKITLGISDTYFGSDILSSSVQFAALVLRSLGYNDSAGDFYWENSLDKMVSLGIMTIGEADEFFAGGFRGDIAAISYLSLFANLKGAGKTLLEKLYLDEGAVTADQLRDASAIDSRISMFSNIYGIAKPYPEMDPLGAEEIYAMASDAVFRIDARIFGEPETASGSGFFITSDGIAVTNYHVITFISDASVITTDGETHEVEGILAIDTKADLAIIKIKGSGFHYLDVGDPSALRNAQRIYCIGSPYGLDDTFTEGLVSNPDREYEGHTYIQISAPIAPGSSGGALLNEYGQVVGVTAAGFDQGSVNFAVKITDLADVFRFPRLRSITYLYAHTHFGAVPVSDKIYTRAVTGEDGQMQIMDNDSLMYGTIKGAGDVHCYALDVLDKAEMIISLASDETSGAGLKFEVSDPSGAVVMTSLHYGGEAFSIAKGPGFATGSYTVRIFVEDNGEDWTNVDYVLFWLYHEAFADSDDDGFCLEFEPNDTPEYANYLPDSVTYLSSISSASDVDYYTFTLENDSTYSAYIAMIMNSNTSVLNAEVFDTDGNSAGKFEFGFFEFFEAQLPAGKYFIRVSVEDTGLEWDNESYLISGQYLD